MTNRWRGWALCGLGAMALGGTACGAKTGLLVPDITQPPLDAVTMDDAFVRFDACVAGRFDMVRRHAQIMFVIDRSGSMEAPLPGTTGGGTRWTGVRDAIASALPPIEATVDIGAIFYPRTRGSTFDPISIACDTRSNADVAPARGTASEIVGYFRTTQPWGGTPTFDALRVAGSRFASSTDRSLAKYVVLATDGGPNCDRDAHALTCACLGGFGPPCSNDDADGPLVCSDADRTVEAIASLAANNVYTYVIGMRDDAEPSLTDALNRMAVAGQRTNPDGPEQFYDVSREEALRAAFQGIVNTIAQCAYVTPSRPDDPDAIQITVAGTPIARDRTHQNGWDWSDQGYGELTLYGDSCTLARSREVPVVANVMCR